MVSKGIFLLDKRHAGFLNGRERKLYESGWWLVAMLPIIACGLLFGLLFLWGSLAEITARAQLNSRGVDGQAQVVSHRESSSGFGARRSTTHYLTYSLTDANGLSYTREQAVSAAIYGAAVGDVIAVRYLPDNPAESRIVGDYVTDPVLPFALSLVILAVPLYLLLDRIWRWWRNRRLEESGQILYGEVMNASLSAGRIGIKLSVQYSFQPPVGMYKQAWASRRSWFLADVPEMGTPVAVLYLNDRVYRML